MNTFLPAAAFAFFTWFTPPVTGFLRFVPVLGLTAFVSPPHHLPPRSLHYRRHACCSPPFCLFPVRTFTTTGRHFLYATTAFTAVLLYLSVPACVPPACLLLLPAHCTHATTTACLPLIQDVPVFCYSVIFLRSPFGLFVRSAFSVRSTCCHHHPTVSAVLRMPPACCPPHRSPFYRHGWTFYVPPAPPACTQCVPATGSGSLPLCWSFSMMPAHLLF